VADGANGGGGWGDGAFCRAGVWAMGGTCSGGEITFSFRNCGRTNYGGGSPAETWRHLFIGGAGELRRGDLGASGQLAGTQCSGRPVEIGGEGSSRPGQFGVEI